jgi:octaprenyl-diphosphate synthase
MRFLTEGQGKDRAMGTSMLTVPPASPFTAGYKPAALAFAPVTLDVEEVDRIFDRALAPYRGPFGSLIDHLRHYRGKRLRPALLLLTAKACGKVTDAHRILAAAVEMIHTATLVHDDVLDEAELRRHFPTVNAGWGNKISILLGDMLFTHAFHLTSTVDRRACEIIGDATNRVCAGELRQVCERGNLNLTQIDYFAIIEGKTAALTECCGRLGALYASVSEDSAVRLANFGRNLGLAFQIADDLLDLVGHEDIAGKTLGTDLSQQKMTLPVIHCLHKLPSTEAESLRIAIRSGGDGLAQRVLAAMGKTQSLIHARRTAEEFARAAYQELECLPRSECRALLESLCDWSVRREL